MCELGVSGPDSFGESGEVRFRGNLGIGHGKMATTSAENLPAGQEEG